MVSIKTTGAAMAIAGTLGAVPTGASGAPTLSCPERLQGTTQSAVRIPAGWVGRNVPLQHTLTGVSINLGDPRAADGAIYDTRTLERRSDGASVESLAWNLADLRDAYLVCSYFGTSVILTRSLAGFTQCKVVNVYRRGAGRAEVRSSRCT